MSVGHVVKVQRVCGRNPRSYSHFLNACENQNRPEHVNELDSNKEQPEGNALFNAFGCKTHSVVTNKHLTPRFVFKLHEDCISGFEVVSIPSRTRHAKLKAIATP